MARKREFDTDYALTQATERFWKYGYTRTSLNDLLAHMGIGRASFYNAFGNKRLLFLRVLDRYIQAHERFIIARLDQTDSGLADIRGLFDQIVTLCTDDPEYRGCLIVNSEVELAPHDPDIRRKIDETMQATVAAFQRALDRARAADEIAPAHDTYALAQYLLNAVRGLRVQARYHHNRAIFDQIVAVTLAALNVRASRLNG